MLTYLYDSIHMKCPGPANSGRQKRTSGCQALGGRRRWGETTNGYGVSFKKRQELSVEYPSPSGDRTPRSTNQHRLSGLCVDTGVSIVPLILVCFPEKGVPVACLPGHAQFFFFFFPGHTPFLHLQHGASNTGPDGLSGFQENKMRKIIRT